MANGDGKVLVVLAAAQFLTVLDQAQAVITLYSLVTAALMIAGGEVGSWARAPLPPRPRPSR